MFLGEFSLFILSYIFIVYLICGVIKGTIGFGMPTVSISLLVFFIDVKVIIALILIPTIIVNFYQLSRGGNFKKIFNENIKVLFSSNIKINDLYKDGLQRDQFLPFIKIIKQMCFEENLKIKEDYRKSNKNNNERYFFPLNEKTNFIINKSFRLLTKNKVKNEISLSIKGRKFIIKNFYEGIARFDFKDLCNKNIGAEDYLKISQKCNFIIIENIPNFHDSNSNQQNRFITLIDIIYENKIKLLVSSENSLSNLSSSNRLTEPFKRTLSRLHELTSKKN